MQNDQELLTRLKASGLPFVVIGGVCVVFHGVPMATFDLDVCCPFGAKSVELIESAFKDLHPTHRLTANALPLELTKSSFGDLKNLYLQTDFGKIDCLSEVAGVGNFEAVLEQSVVATLPYGEYRFLSLDALIAAKKAVGRDRDLDAVRRLAYVKERGQQQRDLF